MTLSRDCAITELKARVSPGESEEEPPLLCTRSSAWRTAALAILAAPPVSSARPV